VSQGTFRVNPTVLRDLSKALEHIHSMVNDGTTAAIETYSGGIAESSIVASLWDFFYNAGSKRDVLSNKLKTFSSNLDQAAESYDYVDQNIVPAQTP